jgi:hypothetical protein
VASASEPRRRPSGSRQGFVSIVGSRACSWRRFDCLQRRRCFGTGTDGAISHGRDGSFGPRPRRVLDDVGVRFGGSEHHRIETSSSHTRPPPYAAGHPATGTRQTALFGAPRAWFHRDQVRRPLRRTHGTVPPGYGNRHSSERRAHDLTGTGNRTSSEARHPTPPGQGTGPLRRRGTPSRPGQCPRPRWQGTPAPGARQPALFGALRARLHGTGNPALFGASGPPPHRDREPDLFGGAAPHPTGTGNRTSSEVRPPISPGQDLAMGWTPRPLGPADGAPRSTDRHASPGPGNRRSSEHRAPGLVRDRDLELFGARAPRTHRDREPGPLRRTGAPHLGRAGTFSLAPATVAPRSAACQEPGLEPRTSSETRTLHLTGHRQPRPSGQGHRRLAGRDQRTVRPSLR